MRVAFCTNLWSFHFTNKSKDHLAILAFVGWHHHILDVSRRVEHPDVSDREVHDLFGKHHDFTHRLIVVPKLPQIFFCNITEDQLQCFKV